MPRGERFYYRHKQAVIDGTRCNDEKLDVCVGGQCLPVGCDMLLGSDAQEDKCRECRGDGSSCQTVEGVLDTDDLQVGYNDILLIPAGATNIRINELKASSNYLAVRNLTGHYYLNGDWRIDFPRSLRFAGTIFHYERVPHAFLAPESISALGPTTEAIYIVLLYQGTNPGIRYEYSIPKGISQPTDPDSYAWIPGEFTECSATCGGGFQIRNVSCVRRKDLEVVSEDLCNPVLEPQRNESCGTEPCAPEWFVGDWDSCSTTCGGGIQMRQVYCQRIVSNNLPSIVDDEQCSEVLGPKPNMTQPCNEEVVCPTWHIGPWKPCDRLCGEGRQRRRVRCYRKVDGKIEVLDDSLCSPDKPEEEKSCHLRPCEGVDWIFSEWSGCENKCGLTYETREVHCASQSGVIYPDKFCQPYLLGPLKRECISPIPCEHEWFASQWSECSTECGSGVQTRKVFCGTFDGESIKKVDDEKCDLRKKYEDTKNCTAEEECLGQWYHGPWSSCDKECGGGKRTRKVMCLLGDEKTDITKCDASTIPFGVETCNNHQCSKDEIIPVEDSVSLEEECEDEEDTYFTADTVLDTDGTTLIAGTGKEGVSADITDSGTTVLSVETEKLSSVSDIELTVSTGEGKETPESSLATAAMAEEFMLSDAASTFEDEGSGFSTDSFDATTDSSIDESTDEYPTSSFDTMSTDEPDTVGSTSTIDTTEMKNITSSLDFTATTTDATKDQSTAESTTLGLDALSSISSQRSTDSSSTRDEEESSSTPQASSSVYTEDSFSTTVDDVSETTMQSESVTAVSSSSGSTDQTVSETTSELSTETEITDTSSSSSPESTTTDVLSSVSSFGTTSETEISSASTVTSETENAKLPEPELEIDDKELDDILKGKTESSTLLSEITSSGQSAASSESSTLLDTAFTTEGSSSLAISESSSTITEISVTSETSEETETVTDSTAFTESSSTDIPLTVTEISSEVTETTFSSEGGSSPTTEITTSNATVSEDVDTTTAETASDQSTLTTESEPSSTGFTGSTSVYDELSSTSYITTSKEVSWETATTLKELITTIKSKGKKCRRRKPKVVKCEDTKFGCCADGITKAEGPFSQGCPQPETCNETKYGCCPDEVSPAAGPNWEGCPPSLCAQSLFGCCPDNVTTAEGNDFEGCPDEIVPFDCKTTQFGCCPDGVTQASGPDYIGCFECEGSGECTCAETKYGCCPNSAKAATGPDNAGCYEEPEGSGVTPPSNETEPEGDCANSLYGCCPDEITEATGPHFAGCGVIDDENCTASYYGCCPDDISPALGPDYLGCRMPCEDEKYGCCSDRITPAHGPNEEGCCLNSIYGCCPDNVLPAQGPNLEGCGCEYTRYGCCPDNKTAARGPEAEGCGCQFTKHGCCPNGYTPAAGPEYQGCPCYTFQFGCCPDGVTRAVGLHNQGCGCENTEFGCCSDNKTPSSGPNMEGCGCEASSFGCCPDGISVAQGEKFEGCEDVPLIPSETCTLPKDRGACRDFTVKWFFDTEYGGCSRFWYGGCEGNTNRFKTQDECKETCVEPPGREACFLPKIAGPCEGYYPTWYYDSDRKQCGQFIYGGCLGNNNKFQTREECEELCVLPDTIDSCQQPKDEGPCRGNYRRWYFNKETGVCEEFSYGGCKGNRNNFLTEASCHQQCLQPGRRRDSCSLPRAQGNCTERLPRWYFDVSENRCMPFYYSGCGGNANRYETHEGCEADCPPKVEQDICILQPLVGECHNYTERWYYDSYEVRCRQFYYGGCGGNENNFLNLQDCENRCEKRFVTAAPPVEFRRESCFLPDDHGPCSEDIIKWFYDSRDGVCKQFMYGGCEGNDNRFTSQQECEEKCGDVQDVCDLPRVVGPCNGNVRQWYYDKAADTCYEFDYGGCRGNKNKFDDKEQCEHRCKKVFPTTSGPDVSLLLLTTQDPNINEIVSSDICSAPVDPGPCRDSVVAWYYDERTGRCSSFVYGGCEGNANRFQSEEQCERQCGVFKGQDVCNINYDPGVCEDSFQKWFFDGSSQSCRQFSYTGCGGNGNRFSSQEECESVCIHYQELHPHGNDTTLSRQAICRLPVDSGPCTGGYHKRWYFDDDRQTCIPFIYTGCAGNLNRFKNFQSCLSFCSVVIGIDGDNTGGPEQEKPSCESAKEDCSSLRCPYGIERFINEDDCEICQCHDPCKNHFCPEGSKCAVDLYRNVNNDDTEFRAVCRPVSKAGECPKIVETTNNCIQECQSDADCTDVLKCCFNGCGSSCLRPALPEDFVTTSVPIRPPERYEQPPVIAPTETEIQAEEGSHTILKCIARGNPTPSTVWRKDSVVIEGTNGRHKLLLDGSLQIIGLYRSDAGVYICTADNGVGQPATKEYHLDVTDPQRRPAEIIGEDSTYVVVTLGVPTSLHCYTVGWPRPSVTWWRGDRMLPLSSEQYEQRRDYSLLIRSVTLRQLGPYTCQAYNGLGRAASWTVTLQAVGPVYTVDPADSAYLRYLIEAPKKPKPEIQPPERPTYPFRPVRPPHRRPRPPVFVPSTTTTEVTFVEATDAEAPEPERPRVFVVPVQANVTLERTEYPVGSDISIPCSVDGYPIPTVEWFKDDIPVEIGNRIQISESHRLQISRAEGSDSGVYRCEASNQFGSSSSSVTIQVRGVYVHPNCIDNPFFANCLLIVKAQYCTHKYYARFCCKSCTLAGQLPSYGPHLERTGINQPDARRK